MPATVVGIEYDPNRTCHIALLQYEDGTRRYILAPRNVTDGEVVLSSAAAIEPKPGNCMPLKHIPTGLTVHSIEFEPGKGGALCRSAGSGARLSNKEGRWATIVLPSGEIRQVSLECRATVAIRSAAARGAPRAAANRRAHRARSPRVGGRVFGARRAAAGLSGGGNRGDTGS